MRNIAYIVDSLDWIQAQRVRDLQPYLPDHELHVMLPSFASLSGPWDAVWVASWRILLAHPEIQDRLPAGRTLLGVTSHYNLGGGLKPETCFRTGSDPAEEFAKAIAILKRFRLVTCNSKILYDLLSPHLPDIILAQNGVDAEAFCPQPYRHRRLWPRGEFGTCFGWVGKLRAAKNYPAVLAAKNALADRFPHYHILPMVMPKDGRRMLQHKGRGMPVFHRSNDFFIVSSYHEGTPNPALEAAACGVPLISTRVGNIPEFLIDDEMGWFIDPTAEDIVDCIKLGAMIPKVKYMRMSKAIRAEILENWSWPKRAVAYRKALEVVCG